MDEQNVQNEKSKDELHYKLYWGSVPQQMPKLIAEDCLPITVAQLMRVRLDTQYTSTNRFFWHRSFLTGDCVAYHPDGKIKIILSSEIFRSIHSGNVFDGKGMFISEELYKTLPGTEFSKKEIKKHIFKNYRGYKGVVENPLWFELAGRDYALLADYAKKHSELAKKIYSVSKHMSIFLLDSNSRNLHDLQSPLLTNCEIGSICYSNADFYNYTYSESSAPLLGVKKGKIIEEKSKTANSPNMDTQGKRVSIPYEKLTELVEQYVPKANLEAVNTIITPYIVDG